MLYYSAHLIPCGRPGGFPRTSPPLSVSLAPMLVWGQGDPKTGSLCCTGQEWPTWPHTLSRSDLEEQTES